MVTAYIGAWYGGRVATLRYRADWATDQERLTVLEPTWEELCAVARPLRDAYNDPHNRAMMAHEGEMSDADVLEHFQSLLDEAKPLLLFRDDQLAGDADFRNLSTGAGEFAILVAARAAQGRGLGTRFAILAHALAFHAFALERVFVTVIPQNAASRRLFEKIGYAVDASPEARRFVDDPSDVALSLERAKFERLHRTALAVISITRRS